MKTVQATDTAVSIWITREQAPTGEQMLSLVRQALADRGLAPWAETEAECFAAGEDTLVIARPGPGRRLGFYFADLEELLGAALAGGPGDGSLYDVGRGYMLALAPEAAGPALYEYGAPRTLAPGWEEHAREQGMCLLRDSALAQLRGWFGGGV